MGHRVFRFSFASLYPLYVKKVENKSRTQEELDQVIRWLTGYTAAGLQKQIRAGVDLQTFFAEAPRMNPQAQQITGVVCGVRVEEIKDPMMKNVRWLDKLVDELARGKALASVLRAEVPAGKPPRVKSALKKASATVRKKSSRKPKSGRTGKRNVRSSR